MTNPEDLEDLKVGDMVEILEGSFPAGAHGMFHGITLDGRYDIELGFNHDWPHRHIYLSNPSLRKLPDRKEEL